MNTRTAVIRGGDATRVARYLPGNYEVIREDDDGDVVISGTDNAGWTLDGYVLPRLSSGLMFGTEVFGACIVNRNRDGATLWDCTCRECLAIQRDWYRTNGDEA
jgi:hypothetical protein